MKAKNYLTISMVLITFTLLIIGCSSSIKPIKPGGTNGDKIVDSDSPLQTERASTGSRLKFPVSGDSSHDPYYFQSYVYRIYLAPAIRLYRRATGTYPESMSSFVRSGFPLHWPRNVITGAPVGVLVGRKFNLDKSDLGLIKWEKFSDDHAKLTFVDLDYSTFHTGGTEIWIERSIEFKWRRWEEYDHKNPVEDIHRSFKEGLSPADDEWSIDIMGGTVPVNYVLSKEKRLIYGMCAQITGHVCSSTERYYSLEKKFGLPSTFEDLYNEYNLIILENFSNFSSLIKSSGADFKIGFDNNKSAQYSWLKIGDEVLIAFIRAFDPNAEYGIAAQYLGSDELGSNADPDFTIFNSVVDDMSAPMITSNNLDQLEIPNEIMVSIEDIPLGD